MIKKIAIGFGVFSVIAGAIAIPSAHAYRGDMSVQGPNYSYERHEAMENAFETANYEAWKSLMQGKGRVTQIVNEKNFSEFARAHILFKEGKKDEAASILKSLGLAQNNGSGMGNGFGRAERGQKWAPRGPTGERTNTTNL